MHKDKNFEGLFSGEHEFVAECYRRLVQRNRKYPSKVFIDYSKPVREEKNALVVHPDLIFRDNYGRRTAVKVKPVWDIPTDLDDLYQYDKDRISGDYEKLRVKYNEFESKVLLVPFLGEKKDYKRNTFKRSIESLAHGNSSIEVITC